MMISVIFGEFSNKKCLVVENVQMDRLVLGWVVLSVYELTPPLEIVYWAGPPQSASAPMT